jgi:hypothetical protein
VSRKEIRAAIWLNNGPIPKEICEREPEVAWYGFYRRLNNGKLEFVSFCNPDSKEWLAMHKDDFAELINRGTAPKQEQLGYDFSPLLDEIEK